MEIYCVKIRQRRLPNKSYFPFERMYFVPHEFFDNDYWKQIFPYMLVVESPKTLLEALDKMNCDESVTVDVDKGPEHVPSKTGSRRVPPVSQVMPDIKSHRIVIPTYKYKTKLGYMWSYLKQSKLQGVELSLYTPEQIIPSMCYRCVSISHKYAGECQPTDSKCRELIKLDLPVQKGESECQSDSDKHQSRG